MTFSLVEWLEKEVNKIGLGGPGSGNHGHKGRPGQRGGSDDDGIPNASDRSSSPDMDQIKRPTDLKKWRSALSKLGGKGDKREAIGSILEKNGYKYETTFNTVDGGEDMYIRGKWNIFVYWNGKSTKVTLKDSHKGNF
jgi:hypothetical protein